MGTKEHLLDVTDEILRVLLALTGWLVFVVVSLFFQLSSQTKYSRTFIHYRKLL